MYLSKMKTLEKLSLFNTLSTEDKNNIFFTTLWNDSRYLNENHKNHLRRILNECNIKSTDYVKQIMIKIFPVKFVNIVSQIYFYDSWIVEIDKLKKIYPLSTINESILINYIMINNNLCPLLNYAFDLWIPSLKIKDLLNHQAELSVNYLYRNVKIYIDNREQGKFFKGAGAYSNVFINQQGLLEKVPKNLASKSFANYDEFSVNLLLSKHDILFNHVPHPVCIRDNGIIEREYIEGYSGDYILKNLEVTEEMRNKLFILYSEIMIFYNETSIRLDIHPGNFVWYEKKKKWMIIDLGSAPLIGYEYYPLNSFTDYFLKIWMERNERMNVYPIRSIELNLYEEVIN